MQDHIKIRPATLEDLPTLLEFEQGVIAAERPVADNLKSGDITYYDIPSLITNNQAQLLVVETKAEQPMLIGSGYMKIMPSKPHQKFDRHGYIGFIYLLPKYRGQGISQQLIQHLINWGKSNGIHEVILDVYAENSPAVKAYKKLGFKENLVEMRIEV